MSCLHGCLIILLCYEHSTQVSLLHRALYALGLTSAEATHSSVQSVNFLQRALPFNHASALRLNGTHSPSINPSRGGMQVYGSGKAGSWDCWSGKMSLFGAARTHSTLSKAQRSAELEADCVARLLALQLLSLHNRDK